MYIIYLEYNYCNNYFECTRAIIFLKNIGIAELFQCSFSTIISKIMFMLLFLTFLLLACFI